MSKSNFRNLFVGSCLTILSVTLPLKQASAKTLGPVPDFKGFAETTPSTQTIQTEVPKFFRPILRPFCLRCLGLRDEITIRKEPIPVIPIPFFALTYIDIDFSSPLVSLENIDPNTEVTFTDIYALDLEPSKKPNEIPLVTGFNAANPEITLESDETFFGAVTGNPYTSFSTTTSALKDLPTLFPDFDLSAFTGNPDSIVHITQTNVPLFDVGTVEECVPEPTATLSVLTLGTLGTVFTFNRHKKRNKPTTKAA